MSFKRRIGVAAVTVAAGAGLALGPSAAASAESPRLTAPASEKIRVAAYAYLHGDVDANIILGSTDANGSGALATCKRWSGFFEDWVYWIHHYELDKRGYVHSEATNLTHSHLNRCT
ncbi:hypothetical protein [Streptomyces aureocirculatus]|uniref:hypothetical protein n=1 Tax=Streptomyces aureocirculatus TaxID=67275 RepID=UPI0004CA679D|nr:hypothetical protein [Streptomyces aureocirculatus]